MNAVAWAQLLANWRIPLSAALLWQCTIAGGVFSGVQALQSLLTARSLQRTSISGCLFVLGYWRSGTTLLHNYLACDRQLGYATTYACMNPHHFVLTQQSMLTGAQRGVQRPMDDVTIFGSSPQEDEFALLSLGARSPYEALLVPNRLDDALKLADPRELQERDKTRWESVFMGFLRAVSVAENGRPLVLKSPTHGYRVATLRKLLPDARFIHIVRHPDHVYESTVRMWRRLFQVYALSTIPPEIDTRLAVLADRPRFESVLDGGLAGLSPEQLVVVRYEELVKSPVETIGRIYEQLKLHNFAAVESSINTQNSANKHYAARNSPVDASWVDRVRKEWAGVYEKYSYDLR